MSGGRGWRVLASAAGLWLLAAAPASAQCTISTTAVAFGSYDVLNAAATTSTGTVTFNCSLPASVTVDLDKGQNSSVFSPRKMTKGSGPLLPYDLYIDAAMQSIWGDGSAGTSHYTNNNPPILTNVTLTVYGRIPPNADVTAGSYSDTVVATIIF